MQGSDCLGVIESDLGATAESSRRREDFPATSRQAGLSTENHLDTEKPEVCRRIEPRAASLTHERASYNLMWLPLHSNVFLLLHNNCWILLGICKFSRVAMSFLILVLIPAIRSLLMNRSCGLGYAEIMNRIHCLTLQSRRGKCY